MASEKPCANSTAALDMLVDPPNYLLADTSPRDVALGNATHGASGSWIVGANVHSRRVVNHFLALDDVSSAYVMRAFVSKCDI